MRKKNIPSDASDLFDEFLEARPRRRAANGGLPFYRSDQRSRGLACISTSIAPALSKCLDPEDDVSRWSRCSKGFVNLIKHSSLGVVQTFGPASWMLDSDDEHNSRATMRELLEVKPALGSDARERTHLIVAWIVRCAKEPVKDTIPRPMPLASVVRRIRFVPLNGSQSRWMKRHRWGNTSEMENPKQWDGSASDIFTYTHVGVIYMSFRTRTCRKALEGNP